MVITKMKKVSLMFMSTVIFSTLATRAHADTNSTIQSLTGNNYYYGFMLTNVFLVMALIGGIIVLIKSQQNANQNPITSNKQFFTGISIIVTVVAFWPAIFIIFGIINTFSSYFF